MNNGVNFQPLVKDVSKEMIKVVDYILSQDISPEDKILRLRRSFNSVGGAFYSKAFDDNSKVFDSTIKTLGNEAMEAQVNGLAQEIVRNNNLGRDTKALVDSFYSSNLGKAQMEAFKNAVSMAKHPTLRRIPVGKTCAWCNQMAGTYTQPTGEMFARHSHCDCLFIVSGYKSRNGILTNYVHGKKPVEISDNAAIEKIGVTKQYWKKEMVDSERWFAKNYPDDITWISKDKVVNNVRVSTNDFILDGREYELKSPEKIKYSSISHNIQNAAAQGKENFMINLQGRVLPEKVRRQLESYNINNPTNQIRILRVFTKKGEIWIDLLQ